MTAEQVTLIIGLTTAAATIVSVAIQQLLSYFLNRRKENAQTRQISAGTDLTTAEAVEKWQNIAFRAGDENDEMAKNMRREKEAYIAEKEGLLKEIDSLRQDVKNLNDKFEQAEKENEQWKDWARRLVLQLESWNISPVPWDLDEAKKSGRSLGDMGNYKPKENNIDNSSGKK
jgi:hypothetical protein